MARLRSSWAYADARAAGRHSTRVIAGVKGKNPEGKLTTHLGKISQPADTEEIPC
jgi:hypothetical protein